MPAAFSSNVLCVYNILMHRKMNTQIMTDRKSPSMEKIHSISSMKNCIY